VGVAAGIIGDRVVNQRVSARLVACITSVMDQVKTTLNIHDEGMEGSGHRPDYDRPTESYARAASQSEGEGEYADEEEEGEESSGSGGPPAPAAAGHVDGAAKSRK